MENIGFKPQRGKFTPKVFDFLDLLAIVFQTPTG